MHCLPFRRIFLIVITVVMAEGARPRRFRSPVDVMDRVRKALPAALSFYGGSLCCFAVLSSEMRLIVRATDGIGTGRICYEQIID